jgi:dTDP-glucose 4,6-dehydratase
VTRHLVPVPDAPTATLALTGRRGHLADRLAQRLVADGERVVVLAPPDAAAEPGALDATVAAGPGELLFVEHDPEDPQVPDALLRGVDAVVHVAAGPEEDSLRGLSSATLDTLFALRLARLNGARLVIASTPGNADHLHADEALAAGYRSSHDVDTVLARVAECYGPGMPPQSPGVVARMLEQAQGGGPVLVDTDDHERHSLCFVDDVVEGLLVLARTRIEGPVYLGPDVELSTAEVAREVARATGTRYRVVERRRGHHAHSAPSRAVSGEHPPGWRPTVDLAEGLRRCVAAGQVVQQAGQGEHLGRPERIDLVDLVERTADLRTAGTEVAPPA